MRILIRNGIYGLKGQLLVTRFYEQIGCHDRSFYFLFPAPLKEHYKAWDHAIILFNTKVGETLTLKEVGWSGKVKTYLISVVYLT